ncbi:HAD family hydrolase [Ornithinimicrobium sediminis]|uniref:HAD family hydrolase n=1 Tax=Ornithinimicrobium sediminis TaxID=2904603 RepID=UPI002FCDA75E
MVRDRELPAAVLWDMDGTIIDTEPFWMAEEHALVRAAGGRWTDRDALDLVGNDLTRSAEVILARTPVTGTPEEVVHRLLAGVVRRTQERIPWRPGAQELLAELVALGVPNALVTMSWDSLATVLVEALPPGTFRTVVTGDVVTRGKPDPEPYRVAAQRLGVEPARCVAIEDSPTGVRSATSAGVPTLAVPHIVDVPAQPGARQVSTLAAVRAGDLLRLTR